jgi:cell wall-associated NlpC family hydrolase
VSAVTADHAADWARSRKGSPYMYGAAGPHHFDCSGLTRWVYKRVGMSLPHSASAQASKVQRISRSHARRGDLVFFHDHGAIYHVGIYAGHGYVWHAPYSGTRVRREHIWTSQVSFGRVR